MPHLHTMPGGHDVTASAMIFRLDDDAPRMLVHLHKKLKFWLQPGGHVEHTEDPWQGLLHEVLEETGFDIEQLTVCQALAPIESHGSDVPHPAPAFLSTHQIGDDHFHSDLKWVLIAEGEPRHALADGESHELAWVTPEEYVALGAYGKDVLAMMQRAIEDALPGWKRYPAGAFVS